MDPRIPNCLLDPIRNYAERLEARFPGSVTGIYLHGSIALGAFDPDTSDIDFVTVTERPLTGRGKELKALHRDLAAASPWGRRFEGLYAPRSSLESQNETPTPTPMRPGKNDHLPASVSLDSCGREGDRLGPDSSLCRSAGSRQRLSRSLPTAPSNLTTTHPLAAYPYFQKGRRGRDHRLGALAQALLRERGIAVAGPPPASLFPEVPRRSLDGEMGFNLNVYWAGRTRRPHRFLFDQGVDFAVSTIPRILYTLETGKIISKPQAVDWLRESFPEWRSLADDVISRREHRERLFRRSLLARLVRARATLRFVRATIDYAGTRFPRIMSADRA